jgi:hypothetical protein
VVVAAVLAAGQGVGQAFLAPDVINAVLGESVFLAERDALEAFVALRPAVDYRGGRDHVRDSARVVVEPAELFLGRLAPAFLASLGLAGAALRPHDPVSFGWKVRFRDRSFQSWSSNARVLVKYLLIAVTRSGMTFAISSTVNCVLTRARGKRLGRPRVLVDGQKISVLREGGASWATQSTMIIHSGLIGSDPIAKSALPIRRPQPIRNASLPCHG